MMDWLAKMIGLPEVFLASAGQGGGGVIQVHIKYKFISKLVVIPSNLKIKTYKYIPIASYLLYYYRLS